MRKTVLYARHLALNAKIFSFAGFEMPLSYSGILQEHNAVRHSAGLFDVSHMGIINVSGSEAAEFLDFLATNHIREKPPFTATYAMLCASDGGTLDDVIIFRKDKDHFFVIVNAANRDENLNHIKQQAKNFSVAVEDLFDKAGILALQGPESLDRIKTLFPESQNLKHMHFAEVAFKGKKALLSNSGYTGELGFEFFADADTIAELWDHFIALGIQPCGLGARDLLRIEMGYPLYGHELSRSILPLESPAAWTVKLDKPTFLGKEALLRLEDSPSKRFTYGLLLEKGALAREGFDVVKNGRKIGHVTSGAFSPILEQPIALALVDKKLEFGEEVAIPIRERAHKATVVKLPFIKRV